MFRLICCEAKCSGWLLISAKMQPSNKIEILLLLFVLRMVLKCQFYEKCVEAKRINLWWPQQEGGGRDTEILAEFDLSRISFVVKLNLEEALEDSRSEISPLCSRCSYKGELRISLPASPSKGCTSEVDYLLPILFHSCHWIFPETLVKTNLLGLLRQTSSRKFQAEMVVFLVFFWLTGANFLRGILQIPFFLQR